MFLISKEVCSLLREAAWVDAPRQVLHRIHQSIQSGFQIGHDRHNYLVSATSNLNVISPLAVTEYLSREVALDRMWKIHISKWQSGKPIGHDSKKEQTKKW